MTNFHFPLSSIIFGPISLYKREHRNRLDKPPYDILKILCSDKWGINKRYLKKSDIFVRDFCALEISNNVVHCSWKIRYQFHDRSVTGQSQRAQWHIKSISTGVAGYIWVLLGEVGGSPCIILIRTYWFGLSKGSGQRWQQMGDGRAENHIKWSYCRPRGKHAKENENNSLESGSGLLRPLLTLIAPILAFVIFIRM